MNGKDKCNVLKEIRKSIAKQNNIPFELKECSHKGECKGTCPRCEAEVRYLERELKKRRKLGKTVALAGISAAAVLGTTGCSKMLPIVAAIGSQIANPENLPETIVTPISETEPSSEEMILDGDIVPFTDQSDIEGDIEILDGEVEADMNDLDEDICVIQ